MSVFVLISVMIASSFVVSCKKDETTKAPLPRSSNSPKKPMAGANASAETANGEQKPQVIGVKDVSLDEMPRVTVNVDLSGCVGTGRWFDPKTPATPRLGAVSITVTATTPGDSQPDPWVYEPVVNTASDGAVSAKGQHAWRLAKSAVYAIDGIAYNVQTSNAESKVSTKIDFKSSNDITLKIIGSWKTTLCEIKFAE